MSTMLTECGACGLWKAAAEFYRDVRYTDRWMPRSTCKACMKVKRKAPSVHWLAKVCTGCKQMVPLSGYYIQAGSPHMPCKTCRADYQAPVVEVAEKQCSKCGVVKPATEFSPSKTHASRLNSSCRACQNAYRPLRVIRPLEKRCSVCKATKPADEFYSTDKRADGLYARCKDCHNQRAAPGQASYRKLNQERVKGWLSEWERANRDTRRTIYHRRRAAERQVESTFTREQWAALKAAYANCCAYCGKASQRLTIDHVIPLSQGGPHVVQNIVPACKPCNSGKKDRAAPTHQTHLFS